MKRRWCTVGVLCAALWSAGAGSLRAAEPQQQTFVTRQSEFVIPFEMPTSKGSGSSLEVDLFVSSDQGKTWQRSGKAQPSEQQFRFKAEQDGEYWFAVYTVDLKRPVTPPANFSPDLKVIIDTAQPQLEAECWLTKFGELIARWSVDDPRLKTDSLQLEYQLAGEETWNPLEVPPSATASQQSLIGEGKWSLPDLGSNASFRVTVSDLAGNSTARVMPIAARTSPMKSNDQDPQVPTLASQPGPTELDRKWAPDQAQTIYPAKAYRSRHTAAHPNTDDAVTSWHQGTTSTSTSDDEPQFREASRTRPPQQTRPVLDFELLPAGERPRMVNVTRFAIEYEIDLPGSSGIGAIELWGTRDGGQSWELFTTDENQESPVEVTVDGPGIYGFQIMVQSRSGSVPLRPKSGDLPELWIGVDLTAPEAKITGTETSPGGDQLIIHWKADDDVLDSRPITLSFSADASGPWTPIAAGLPNRGEFVWRFDDRVPNEIYLQLEVRDDAGNVTAVTAPDPIDLGREKPTAHIRAVRPIGHQ